MEDNKNKLFVNFDDYESDTDEEFIKKILRCKRRVEGKKKKPIRRKNKNPVIKSVYNEEENNTEDYYLSMDDDKKTTSDYITDNKKHYLSSDEMDEKKKKVKHRKKHDFTIKKIPADRFTKYVLRYYNSSQVELKATTNNKTCYLHVGDRNVFLSRPDKINNSRIEIDGVGIFKVYDLLDEVNTGDDVKMKDIIHMLSKNIIQPPYIFKKIYDVTHVINEVIYLILNVMI